MSKWSFQDPGNADEPRRQDSDTPPPARPWEERRPSRRDFGGDDRPRREFSNESPPRRDYSSEGPPRRDFGGDDRPRRSFTRDDGPRRSFGGDDGPRRSFGRDDGPRRPFDRDARPPRRDPVGWRAGEDPEDRSIEEMDVWRTARTLFKSLHDALASCLDVSFRDRLLGASLTLLGHIADGTERGSQGGFMRLLEDSRGNCGEIRSLLHVAVDLGHLTEEIAGPMRASFAALNKSLAGLQRPLRREY